MGINKDIMYEDLVQMSDGELDIALESAGYHMVCDEYCCHTCRNIDIPITESPCSECIYRGYVLEWEEK